MKSTVLPKRRIAKPDEVARSAAIAPLSPKLLTFGDVRKLYALTRGKLYPILKRYPDMSITLVEPGKKRGVRRIVVAKLEAYLARLAAEQHKE